MTPSKTTNSAKGSDAPASTSFEIEAAPGGNPINYQDLNEQIHKGINAGAKEFTLNHVCGQRFIGAALTGDLRINVHGVAGNDLGIYMDGPTLEIFGNGEDQIGNTMNNGKIIIHGRAGDVVGLSARGGEIYIRDNVGFRVGIHTKQFQGHRPVIVIGGIAREYLGEYMSGGLLVVLGLKISAEGKAEPNSEPLAGNCLASGIHGGKIILRCKSVPPEYLGVSAKIEPLTEEDRGELDPYLKEFARVFHVDESFLLKGDFIKIVPISKRPFQSGYSAALI